MDYNKLAKKVAKIVKRASKIYYKQDFFEMEECHKYEKDDVTNNDVATQNYLQYKLLHLIPNSGFIGEEGCSSNVSYNGYVWIIDPIDGTQNYKKDIPLYGTQLALQYNGETVISVIYFPAQKQM